MRSYKLFICAVLAASVCNAAAAEMDSCKKAEKLTKMALCYGPIFCDDNYNVIKCESDKGPDTVGRSICDGILMYRGNDPTLRAIASELRIKAAVARAECALEPTK